MHEVGHIFARTARLDINFGAIEIYTIDMIQRIN